MKEPKVLAACGLQAGESNNSSMKIFSVRKRFAKLIRSSNTSLETFICKPTIAKNLNVRLRLIKKFPSKNL